ncbi:MAG: 3-methylcrotonyl-CoA carboxylase, partial [Halioglobus sp.]|nr:3-methylcrotonyl-CoA carboxylase [Halioglobus sp.]
EHPVTELITGLDLVALQLRVAQGEPLPLTQDAVTLDGHAIEVRLYSEDPAQDFLPTSGPIALWSPPSGKGIRVDSGIATGQHISPYYDPMLAKIIACGPSRDSARLRLIEALETCVLFGPAHNRDFLVACLNTDSFARGEATTAFIEEEFGADTAGGRITRAVPGFRENAAAAVIELALEHTALMARSVIVSPELRDWASASALVSRKRYAHGDALYDLSVIALRAGEYRVSAGEDAALVSLHSLADSRAQIEIDGLRHTARYCQAGPGLLHVSLAGCSAEFRDLIRLDGLQDTRAGSGNVIAPMHGLLLDVKVAAGDEVTAGQTLAILEAMKMHYEITADVAGTVREVLVAAGTQVAADDRLLDIDIAPAD